MSEQMETCRFCLDESSQETLVEPCLCRGSVRYVHRECLEREIMARAQTGVSTLACRICNGDYTVPLAVPLLVVSHVLLPLATFYIASTVRNPIIMTILYTLVGMNWTLCLLWKLTPIVSVLRSPTIQHLLSIGLFVPIAHWFPTISTLLSFSIPYIAFLMWVAEQTSPQRIVFGFFGLAEFCLLMGSLMTQTASFNVCLLLSTLSVLPISVLMVTG